MWRNISDRCGDASARAFQSARHRKLDVQAITEPRRCKKIPFGSRSRLKLPLKTCGSTRRHVSHPLPFGRSVPRRWLTEWAAANAEGKRSGFGERKKRPEEGLATEEVLNRRGPLGSAALWQFNEQLKYKPEEGRATPSFALECLHVA